MGRITIGQLNINPGFLDSTSWTEVNAILSGMVWYLKWVHTMGTARNP